MNYEKKYYKYKTKYLQLYKLKCYSGGTLSLEQLAYWKNISITRNCFPITTTCIDCKIIITFDGRKDDGDNNPNLKFRELDENDKKIVSNYLFTNNVDNIQLKYKYHLCKDNETVIFYDSQKLNKFIDKLIIFFPGETGHKFKPEYILNLPCSWDNNRPNDENILIQLLFSSVFLVNYNIYYNEDFITEETINNFDKDSNEYKIYSAWTQYITECSDV